MGRCSKVLWIFRRTYIGLTSPERIEASKSMTKWLYLIPKRQWQNYFRTNASVIPRWSTDRSALDHFALCASDLFLRWCKYFGYCKALDFLSYFVWLVCLEFCEWAWLKNLESNSSVSKNRSLQAIYSYLECRPRLERYLRLCGPTAPSTAAKLTE